MSKYHEFVGKVVDRKNTRGICLGRPKVYTTMNCSLINIHNKEVVVRSMSMIMLAHTSSECFRKFVCG